MEILIKLTEEQEKALTFIATRNGKEPEQYLQLRVYELLMDYNSQMKNEDIIKISDAVRFADIATIESVKTALGIVKVEAEPVVFEEIKK